MYQGITKHKTNHTKRVGIPSFSWLNFSMLG